MTGFSLELFLEVQVKRYEVKERLNDEYTVLRAVRTSMIVVPRLCILKGGTTWIVGVIHLAQLIYGKHMASTVYLR
jgi:hypothetical protein